VHALDLKSADTQVGLSKQQSVAVQFSDAQVMLPGVALKWFLPLKQEEKTVPVEPTLPHVGLSVQQSDAEQVELSQVFVKSLFK